MDKEEETKLIVYEILQQKVETAKYIDIGGLRLYRKDSLFDELQSAIINHIAQERGKIL